VRVAVPDFPSLVADMVTVPTLTAVTNPAEDTVATAPLDDAQATARPASVPPTLSRITAENCRVCDTSRLADDGETSTDETGTGLTVTETGCDTVAALKPGAATDEAVTVTVALPGPTALTTPNTDTDATDGAELENVNTGVGAPAGWVAVATI
jgi:hypothetical protein